MNNALPPSSRLLRRRRFSSTAVALLTLTACGSPSNNSALFAASGAHAAAGAGASTAGSGNPGGAGPGGAGSGGTGISSAGSPGAAGLGAGAGAGGELSTGGSESGAGGGSVDAPQAGSAGTSNTLGDCSAHGAAAMYDAGTQHCYLAVHELNTYADAQTHCASLGAHLATIADEAENAFAWTLAPNEHWIGASDHQDPKDPEPGTYTWLTSEPFTYTAWSAGQPNASKTACGEANGGGNCYEHCAFQWTGGEHDGQWNDRFCLHTIESVCEWEK